MICPNLIIVENHHEDNEKKVMIKADPEEISQWVKCWLAIVRTRVWMSRIYIIPEMAAHIYNLSVITETAGRDRRIQKSLVTASPVCSQ